MAQYVCTMCNFISQTEKVLNYHIIRKHRNDSNFQVTCTAANCFYTSKSWKGFRSHYSRKHRGTPLECDRPNIDNFEEYGLSVTDNSLSRKCATYALKLMGKHKLPATTVNDIIDSTKDFICFAEELKQSGSDCNIIDGLQSVSTNKLRLSFVQRNFNYIPPEEVVLGFSYCRKKGMLKRVKECGYIVPFKESLTNYLNQPEVWREVNENHQSMNEIMQDFCDGAFLKNSTFNNNHPRCLHFIINTDSLELVNPIGPHVKKHKLDVFYWMLANVRPFMRSKWSNIHLLGIVKTNYIRKYGTKIFLQDFVNTLLKLHEGMSVRIGLTDEIVHGMLIACLADTPAAAGLCGMKESSYLAKKGCRHCNINTTDMQHILSLEQLQERCPVLHRERCNDLEEMPERLRPFWSRQWGINCRSTLLQLPYINLAQCTPHDPLHVLLEGLFTFATALILQVGLDDKLFKLNWLNVELKKFNYSYLDSDNRPEEISRKQIFDSVCIKQTAATQLTLSYILPFILGEKFNILNPYYKNFMHLVAIVQLCTSPYATADTAGELQELIEGYLHEFRRLFRTIPLRPKHHFLLHIPLQLLRLGPLRHHCLFRFEGKNNAFKNFRVHNYINIPYSMAKHHQLRSCYEFIQESGERSDNYLYSGDMVKEGQQIFFQEIYPTLQEEFMAKIDEQVDGTTYETKEIILQGLKYRPGAYLLLNWENSWPLFVQIEKLFVHKYVKFAVCKDCRAEHFKWQFNAYCVKFENNKRIIVLKDLINKWPLPGYSKESEVYVTNRYCHFGQGFF